MNDRFRAMLIRHEGIRLKPYRDTEGLLTIGIGRCLDTNGISEAEAYVLFDNDVITHTTEAEKLPVFRKLDAVRQDVMVSMVFNMGLPRLLGFKKMLAALDAGDWSEAANQMLESKWAFQVGNRAQELARMVRTGQYP